MQIMTKEYCEQCPFFTDSLGYIEPDDCYWKEHPDFECVCKKCPRREQCEKDGPQDFMVCLANWIDKRGFDSVKAEICEKGKFKPEEVESKLKEIFLPMFQLDNG